VTILGIGIDAVAIARIARLLDDAGERFVARVFTSGEAAWCRSRAHPAESFAARFAAKEAALKCLRTGWAAGLGFRDVEVVRAAGGAVEVVTHGAALALALRLGIRRWHLSLTHTADTATAFVIAEG
jgi:holo-[acyl-carrier protein] synthase